MIDKFKAALAGLAVAGFTVTASAAPLDGEQPVDMKRIEQLTACFTDSIKREHPKTGNLNPVSGDSNEDKIWKAVALSINAETRDKKGADACYSSAFSSAPAR